MPVDTVTFCGVETQIVTTGEDGTYVGIVESTCDTVQVTNTDAIRTVDQQLDVVTIGTQGPPGIAANAGWTYIQEATPTGSDSETWYQPSAGYGYVYLGPLAMWKRIILENMLADANDHSLDANGGYY